MADVYVELHPEEAQFLASSFPAYIKNHGSNFPVSWLAYDAAATETAYWDLTAFAFGDTDITCHLIWGAASATSGVVRWEVAVAAITPETDTQDVETKAFATAHTVDDTHLGTTAKRLMQAAVTITNIDSLAAGDELWLKVARIGGNAADTMTGDAWLRKVRLTYTAA
jgi:hypothetical protein